MGLFPSDRLLNSLIMVRGPKKHMKRLAAPKSWMLDKLGGVYSVKPSSGPHRQGECMPISIFLRNRLKYALTAKEVSTIMKQRLIKVDGKVRTDAIFPAGFMDVIQIEKTGENFRLIYDVKGRYIIHRITNQEAKYKLCRVRQIKTGPKNVPYLYTSDGRTIRYPDPVVKANDSIRLDINTTKSWIPSNSRPETCAWSLEAVTLVVLEPSCIGKDILVLSILSTLRTPTVTPSPPVWLTSSSSEKEASLTSVCLRARVSNSPQLRSVTNVFNVFKNVAFIAIKSFFSQI